MTDEFKNPTRRTMESDGFIYFQLNINFDGQRTESTFIKCKPKQTIGDAIFDNMADENVAIVKVQTVSPPNKTRADTPTSTPKESGDVDNVAMFVGYFDEENSNNIDSCQEEIVTLEPQASIPRQQEDAFPCVNIRIQDHDSDCVDGVSSQKGLSL
ncbi:unnamed protein product [Mytilus edulis]|uniref:Uncharacterized protein n=1 Tax=Mytilus edulis TaxID=6550 RepID=A0A8S3SZ40_MYTED|nr:unnamed protein product [Mytilus edulis]